VAFKQEGHTIASGYVREVAINKWFSHYLYGIENSATERVFYDSQSEDYAYEDVRQFSDYPIQGSSDVTFSLDYQKKRLELPNNLSETSTESNTESNTATSTESVANTGIGTATGTATNTEIITDLAYTLDPKNMTNMQAYVLAEKGSELENARALYESPELAEDVTLSGIGKVSLSAALLNTNRENLSAFLVYYPPNSGYEIISLGGMDSANRESVLYPTPTLENQFYQFNFDLQPQNLVLKKGGKFALVLMTTIPKNEITPPGNLQVKIDVQKTSLTLPFVGGQNAVQFVQDKPEPTPPTPPLPPTGVNAILYIPVLLFVLLAIIMCLVHRKSGRTPKKPS
jgi:X-Pro dipeptidyl-peptidase